jgi:hypothetical protein
MQSHETKVLKCGCKHEYQDKKYGSGNRVHNEVGNVTKNGGQWRCTVCGKVR